jgi:anti-sigma-K factor RskA
VIAGRPYALTTRQMHELWALPGAGRAPVSLRLLPQSGRIERDLTTAQREALPRISHTGGMHRGGD